MASIERLEPAGIHKLASALERTPDADPWVAEVEDFILRWGPAEIFRVGQGQVLLVKDGADVLGAAIHRPHERYPGAENLAGVIVDHRQRGKRRGEEVFLAVLDEVHRASGKTSVILQVHKDNAAMQHLARKVAGEPEFPNGDYLVFIHDV